jgi:Cu2+-exporting ATPase
MTLISLLKVEKMDHSKRYHDHGSILMGMTGNNQHKMIIKDFKKRFWISLILSVSVIIISPMIQEIFSYKK